MPNIPTIPGSARVPDVEIGARRNVQPKLQALEGVRRTAASANAAIQEGMSVVAEYEMRKQKAEEAATFNATSIKMMKATSDFRHTIRTQPDDQIVNNWGQTSSELKQAITEDPSFQKMRPVAQRVLRLHLDSWQGQSSAEFQDQADKLASQRRKATAIAAAHEFLKTGDPAKMRNAEASLGAAVKAGDMTPEQAEAEKDQFPSTLKTNQIRNMIVHDPVRARDADMTGIPEATQVALQKQANNAINQRQIAAYKDIRKNQEQGKIYTKKELNEMADREEIGGSSIKAALDSQGGEVAPEDIKANVSRVHDMILDIPKDADPDERTQRTAQVMASEEYQHLPNAIKKQFDGDLKAGRSELPEMHRTQAEMMKRTFEDVAGLVPTANRNVRAAPFIEGGLKKLETMPEADFKAAYGHNVTRAQATKKEAAREEAARQWYADGQAQYRAWATSAQGQKAKPQEADAERVRLGFGTYATIPDVQSDFQGGKIDRATAKKILAVRFGIE